jgi:chromosome segregation ATPase
MASRLSPTRIAGIVGGAATVAYGSYYLTQSTGLSKLRQEQRGLETQVFVAQGKSRRSESDVLETETLIKALGQQAQLAEQARGEIAHQLTAALAAVRMLEAQQQQNSEDIVRIQDDLAKSRSSLEQHRHSAIRFKQEAAAAEQTLVTVRGQIAASQQRLNPLNHPRVKELLGKR